MKKLELGIGLYTNNPDGSGEFFPWSDETKDFGDEVHLTADDIDRIHGFGANHVGKYLNYLVTTHEIDAAAQYVHDQWRALKQQAKEDPANPYQGYGPVRVKVRELDVTTSIKLQIGPEAAGDADVYHPLDVPYQELEEDIRNKNTVPMMVLCNGLADFILGEENCIADLEDKLKDFINGTDTEITQFLSKLHHIAFLAGEIRHGSRPYGDAGRDDFGPFTQLSEEVQVLDRLTLLPVAQWILEDVAKMRNDYWAHGWYVPPFERAA
jgi:hypothetical protein